MKVLKGSRKGDSIFLSEGRHALLLLLTPEHRKALSHLLLQPSSLAEGSLSLNWCDSVRRAEALLKNQHFDVVLVSSEFQQQAPHLFERLGRGAVICLFQGDSLSVEDMLAWGAHEILSLDDISMPRLLHSFTLAQTREKAQHNDQRTPQQDVLTGLPQREQLVLCLERAIARAREPQLPFAVLLLKLDDFYSLGANYGNNISDQFILRTQERLQSLLPDSAFVARVGANKFAIVVERLQSSLAMTRIAQRLLDTVTMPIIIGKENAQVKAHIGMAFYSFGGEDANALLQNASIALGAARRETQCCFKRFSKQMELQLRGHFMLERQLRHALLNDELELYYQPRVDLASGAVVGAEALIRWNHPERGLLSPDHFIPVAEESDLIIDLGYWIMERACQDWAALKEWGYNDIHLAINLSFRQFHDKDLPQRVDEIIQRYPINPNHLEFELTETTVMHDYDKVRHALEQIGQKGISFSLDDFGTGYSSLSHMIDLPIEMIKIDRSFVNGMELGGDQAMIVQSIIALAHSLNLKVVSEGVELDVQRQQLRELNCDQCQGYLFSKPLPLDVLCSHLVSA